MAQHLAADRGEQTRSSRGLVDCSTHIIGNAARHHSKPGLCFDDLDATVARRAQHEARRQQDMGASSHEIYDGADQQTVFFDIYEQADEDGPGTEPQLPLKLEANAAAADALAEKGAQTDLAMHPRTYIGIASTPLDLATHGLAAMAMMHTADICRSLKVGHELVCDIEPLPKHDYATHRELLRFDETEAIAAMRRVTACLAELTAEANRGFHETEEDIEYDFIGIWAPHPKVPVGACVSGISAAERDIAFAVGSYPPTEPGGIGLLQLAVAVVVAIKQQARAKGKGKSKGKSKGDKWAPYQPCVVVWATLKQLPTSERAAAMQDMRVSSALEWLAKSSMLVE